ncbi:MAG: hypothetical protein DMG14_30050 [Acidobacteria bacterium]|nr:MAG: hypothetical protein DMG14_30050 [Acidobacteriota bacterium]
MIATRHEEFSERQAQWDAFNQWQSGREPEPLSLEERLAWYVAAFDFTFGLLKPVSVNDIEAKVQFIRHVRERLAHVK